MTRHSEFKMETRRYGDGYTNFVQIECGYCGFDAWAPAKNGGWAMRVFRAQGWKVGAKPNQHRCPLCFGKAKSARRTPDNPAIPKEIGKLIKTRLLEGHVKEALMSTSGLHPRPRMEERSVYMTAEDVMPPRKPAEAPEPAPPAEPWPDPVPAPEPQPEPASGRAPTRGKLGIPGVTVFTRRANAARSAKTYLGDAVEGDQFFTLPKGDGWVFKLAADTTSKERAWRQNDPHPKWTLAAGVRTNIKPLVKEETPMPAPNLTDAEFRMLLPTPTEEPMPPNNTIAPVATLPSGREPTRDERTTIHDALTKAYDIVAEAYVGGGSDRTVAETLNVPRIWVRDMRIQFFGDHDRNAKTESQKKDLDAAITLAKAATTRLLEMAGEAETLEQSLVAARKKLED